MFCAVALQNIDTLERLAGLPEDKVVEAHGSYYTSHCMRCDKEYSFEWLEGELNPTADSLDLRVVRWFSFIMG